MEESNLINNDNIYNTDMSISQSTIGGNATTNNKFNKNDLQEVTGGGGGGIVTQSTAIVYGTETSQTTGNLAPILLILGEGTTIPDVEEEPVLLEEDKDITYNAVINSEYKDRVPTIKLDGSEVSYCDANYVIAVTETDETIPVIYDSQNLSKTFTNNGDNWCRVTFKKPLEVKDQLKLPLNSDNFPDNSKIIVPVISCDENNTGQERNTTITFNIKNFAISHNIQLNVIQQNYKKELQIGDVLYSTNDNKLTLDAQTNGANNTPIAICVIPDVYENFENGDESEGGVHTARFVSLNYMNYTTPATGNKDIQTMYFGNYGTTVGNIKGDYNGTDYVGGKWNTKRCVFKATNQDKTSDKVDNNPGKGYCAPACCCDRYSTPGTKPGDWYLPSVGELYQIYANKAAINEKRTAIKGSGFDDDYYWGNFEYSSDYEYGVYLGNGTISSYYKKNGRRYVLGFLAVEVSKLVN